MSVLIASPFVPFAVLAASFVGSLHCVSMCGGMVALVGRDARSVFLYHLGRLLGYVALGAVAGSLGSTFLAGSGARLSFVAAAALGVSFILLGIRSWRGQPVHLFSASLATRILRRTPRAGAFIAGLVSVLLPCGWLHSFILGAIATGSAFHGALFLFVFWLGTVPALSVAPMAIRRVLRPVAIRAPRLSAMILVVAGIATIVLKFAPSGLHGEHDAHRAAPHEHHAH